MSDLTWVAMPSGKGWTSNRTRDIVDLAFTVYKEYDDFYSEVIVRCTWYSGADSRARRVIGRFYFVDHKQAKKFVEDMLKDTKANASVTDQKSGRDMFLNLMLNESLEEGSPGKSYLYSYAVIDNKYVTKSSAPAPVASTVAPTVPEPATTVSPSVVPGIGSVLTSSVPSISDWTVPVVPVTQWFSSMVSTPEEVKEVVNEVAEVVKEATEEPKTIVINGQAIELSWPS